MFSPERGSVARGQDIVDCAYQNHPRFRKVRRLFPEGCVTSDRRMEFCGCVWYTQVAAVINARSRGVTRPGPLSSIFSMVFSPKGGY